MDSRNSLLTLLVDKAGALGGLGHVHVITTRALDGTVEVDPSNPGSAKVNIGFAVEDLVVDDPLQRQRVGGEFAEPVDEKAIRGTRGNMLGDKVLAAKAFPRVEVHSTQVSGKGADYEITLDMTVRGKTTSVTVPVHVELDGERLFAESRFKLRQSELGMKPLSAALGTIKVADELEVRLQLAARSGDSSSGD